jgi:hypothetical protein
MYKTHEAVEHTPRIDSFELDESDSLYDGKNFYDYLMFMDCEADGLEILDDDMEVRAEIFISEVVSKSRQRFFICPDCGTRTRYLYTVSKYKFRCRSCAGLNYKSQQEYRDCIDYYESGIAFAREVFDWTPPSGICPAEWDAYPLPERPRYMHESAYRKHLQKYKWYQKQYKKKAQEEVEAIMSKIEEGR